MRSRTIGQFWQQRTQRERSILAVGGSLLLLLLVWLLLIDPALQGREQWHKTLPVLRADYRQMQAMAQHAVDAPEPAPTGSMPNRAELERSLTERGLKPQSLTVNDDQVRLTLSDISFLALLEWLRQMQIEVQLVVIEGGVTGRERIDRVDANLSLRKLP